VSLVLSLLAAVGSTSDDQRRLAYQRGVAHWGGKPSMTQLECFDYQTLNQALDRLRDLNADLTQRFIDACAGVINADGELTGDEFALIKGVATTLGCPLPPLEPST
jgi:tellurite resistance protein